MRVQHLRFTGYPNAFEGVQRGSASDVMDVVEFRDIAIKLRDGDSEVTADFDYTETFTSKAVPPPVPLVARDGLLPNDRTRVLHGLKLAPHRTCQGRAKVRLELSLVLKASASDVTGPAFAVVNSATPGGM
jgi:hypothetical protein